MADKKNKEGKKDANTVPAKRSHVVRNVLLTLLIIIIVGAVVFYYLYLSNGIATTALEAAQNPSQLNSILMQKFNQTPEISASYVGVLGGNVMLPSGDPFLIAALDVNVSKYQNDTRVKLSINDSLIFTSTFSNFNYVIISKNNSQSMTTCRDLNNSGYVCNNNTRNSTLTSLLNLFGITKVQDTHISSAYPTFYEGKPCWMTTGNTTINSTQIARLIQSSNTDILTYFNVCIPAASYVPVEINATMYGSNGDMLFIFLHNTHYTQTSSEANVTALP
jgi:flagellar basal body-associated protein FliL